MFARRARKTGHCQREAERLNGFFPRWGLDSAAGEGILTVACGVTAAGSAKHEEVLPRRISANLGPASGLVTRPVQAGGPSTADRRSVSGGRLNHDAGGSTPLHNVDLGAGGNRQRTGSPLLRSHNARSEMKLWNDRADCIDQMRLPFDHNAFRRGLDALPTSLQLSNTAILYTRPDLPGWWFVKYRAAKPEGRGTWPVRSFRSITDAIHFATYTVRLIRLGRKPSTSCLSRS